MQQTVRYDEPVRLCRQFSAGKIRADQADAAVQWLICIDVALRKVEHRTGAVHRINLQIGIAAGEIDRDVRRAAAEIEQTATERPVCLTRQQIGKQPVGLTEVCTGVGEGLRGLVHQLFGFGDPLHLDYPAQSGNTDSVANNSATVSR